MKRESKMAAQIGLEFLIFVLGIWAILLLYVLW